VSSDANLRQVIDQGSGASEQLTGLIAENRADIAVLLGNLLTVNEMTAIRLDAVEQLITELTGTACGVLADAPLAGEDARAVLTELRVGIDRVEPLAGGLHGLVAVGSYPGASAVLLAPFIRRFRSQHPGVSVKLHDGTPTWMDDAVSHGEVDFAIRSAEVPRRFHELAWQPLLEESIMLVVPQQHPLATGDPLDVGVLREETIISTGDLTAGWADYREPLASIGVATDRLEVVAGPTTLVAMVQAGLGVGLLGEMAAEVTLHGDVIARELPRPVWKRDIHISTSTSRRLSAAATIFRDEFVDHCAHRRM
jgi:DNA-binding transcriptional LysR family regulator